MWRRMLLLVMVLSRMELGGRSGKRTDLLETFHPLRLLPQREAAAEQLHQRRQRKKAAAAAVLAVQEASRAKEAKNPEKARVRKEKEEAAAEQRRLREERRAVVELERGFESEESDSGVEPPRQPIRLPWRLHSASSC